MRRQLHERGAVRIALQEHAAWKWNIEADGPGYI
jgi:hypothetical protein